ncbi:Hypothetical protein LUCI_2383 [Lucifera butyrica]|uniref:DUF4280 domain-containing protein n=1 Tax=Lucifera butyrica TaxID=1351585 RepID=A0A498R7E5_9FIRM|nr:DUF4280 domain-containing protein [Lucifera butyrica]VBB07139.1 Hypothetical protein LUCI_2383 [Lucifera butyrica]
MANEKYIVEGAKVRCNQGGQITELKLPDDHGLYFLDRPLLNDQDCIAGVNVLPFGTCKIKEHCQPSLAPCWQGTKTDTRIDGRPALIKGSFLTCYAGGCITIVEEGQPDVTADMVTNSKVDMAALLAGLNGAQITMDSNQAYQPIFNIHDNSPAACFTRAFWKDDNGNLQWSNNVPAIAGGIGAGGETKFKYTSQTQGERLLGANRSSEYADLTRSQRRKMFKGIMKDLEPYEKAGKLGKLANPLAYGITLAGDVGNNWDDLKQGHITNQFAAETGTDMGLAWGTIELSTMAGTAVGGPFGSAAGFVVGVVITVATDGVTIRGKTLRAYLHNWAKEGLERMEELWNSN